MSTIDYDTKRSEAAIVERLRREFRERYATEPRVFFAPGRANLIGAHLDYNGGSVLPVPLQRGTYVAVASNEGNVFRFASTNLSHTATIGSTDDPDPDSLGWVAYAYGIVAEGRRRGLDVAPCDVLVSGNLPRRAGLASSASLELAVGYALARANAWSLDGTELAELAWAVETGYVGVKCGIMDQFSAALALEGHALFLDCAKRTWRHVRVGGACELVVLNTNKARELVSSAFNERVDQCHEALCVLRARSPERHALAAFTPADVEAAREELGDLLYRRARHVTSETRRVADAVGALERGDLTATGRLIRQSHESSAKDYGVSCAELDFLVDRVCAIDGVFGARLTGAGFGGCVIALTAPGAVGPYARETIVGEYAMRFGREPTISEMRIGGGPREVERGGG